MYYFLVLAFGVLMPEGASTSAADAVQPVATPHFVRIPAGAFDMGCVPGDTACTDEEKPRHRVSIGRDFWMMRTEVTVGEYKRFAAATGKALPEGMQEPYFDEGWKKESYPMVGVTWDDAAAYCRSVGGRLPTEAEWEYAARGGNAGWKYVWGDAPIPLVDGRKHANVPDESGKKSRAISPADIKEPRWFDGYDDGYPDTSPVGSFAGNGFGLHDMAGNVWEWCADWLSDEYYSVAPKADPRGPSEGDFRVTRGGAFMFLPSSLSSYTSQVHLRVSRRGRQFPHVGAIMTGIRCVRGSPGP